MINQQGFIDYIKQNKRFLWLAIIIGIVYFIIIRFLYPIPSYYADSFTFVGAAARNQPISFRPIMYSRLIQFFHFISTSDVLLLGAQYTSLLLANLFFFFSSCWLFRLSKLYKWVLYILLICHPFYLFASNYISSDAFFTSFTITWFTLLLWIMFKPRWYIILLHLALLVLLFMLRYNAVYYPLLTALAILFSSLAKWKKAPTISISILLILTCIECTRRATESYAGTKVFSAFSGWQLANNALHVIRYQHIDSAEMKTEKEKEILRHCQSFFATNKDSIPTKASAWYMWYDNSPLKTYLLRYDSGRPYFRKWNALGPVYADFGKRIIIQHPITYAKHFVGSNCVEYIYPKLEIYETYFEGVDTIARVAQDYFKYKSNRVSKHRPAVYSAVFGLWPAFFAVANIILLLSGAWYFFSKRHQFHPKITNRFILLFAAYFFINFFFIILLAPSVLRYNIPVLVLSFPFILFFIKEIISKKKLITTVSA
jgi:hypothetical protein